MHRLFPYGTQVVHDIEDEEFARKLDYDIDLRDDLKDAILEKLEYVELEFDITICNGEVDVLVNMADVLNSIGSAVDDFIFEQKHYWDEEKDTWVIKEKDDDFEKEYIFGSEDSFEEEEV